jgi:hypothetical protein
MRYFLASVAVAFLAFAMPAQAAVPMLSPSLAPPAVQKPIEQARWVTRCRVVKVWRHGPHGRHLVPVRRCRRMHVR